MNQPDLPFDAASMARRSDPEPSHAAAAAARELRSAQHEAILRVLLDADRPLTAEQIGERCGMRKEQVGRRTGELLKANYICQDGEGITGSGRRARAFRVN